MHDGCGGGCKGTEHACHACENADDGEGNSSIGKEIEVSLQFLLIPCAMDRLVWLPACFWGCFHASREYPQNALTTMNRQLLCKLPR